jgi:hypothetical protein
MGNEFGHPEWIDFPRDDTYDPSTGAFVPGGSIWLFLCYCFASSFSLALNLDVNL